MVIVGVLADVGSDDEHMMSGSTWMTVSMVALALFLLACAWMLLRPPKAERSTPADQATERFARGEIDADEFERTLRDLGPGDS